MSNNTTTNATAADSGIEPEAARIIRIIMSVIIMVLGVFGNFMVCLLVYQNRKMRTAMNFFLVNLAICDGIMCLFNIPVTLVYNEHTSTWPFGLALCKLLPALQQVVSAAGVLSLVAVSWERFKWIVLTFNEKMSLKQAKLILLVIWLFGVLNGLPIVGAMKIIPDALYTCSENFPKRIYKRMYTLFNFVLFYAIPVAFITPLYVKMILKLREKTDTSSQLTSADVKRRKSALQMLLIVVITYAICVLPNHIMFLVMDFSPAHHYDNDKKFFLTLNYMTLLLWSNSMINPIIYCTQSGDYARGFIKMLCGGTIRDKLMVRVRRRGHSFVSTLEPTNDRAHSYERVAQVQNNSSNSS